MITSQVKSYTGVPTLHINGRPIPGAAYMTYYTDNNRYADFAAAGYTLFSLPVFFASRTINESSQFPPFKKGIFDGETPDWTTVDKDIADLLAACPDALIFPRVNMTLPTAWELAHTDECCDTAVGERRCLCFSSEAWAAETERLLTLFIRHIQASRYADHIVGYQLACGNTEEWFSFDFKGSVGRRTREAFTARGGQLSPDGQAADPAAFNRFLSEQVAHAICRFAGLVKRLTARRLVVGTFYGYTFECVGPESCHRDMMTVLRSPDVDFICSPVSYGWGRPAGIDHANMTAVDSIKLHGKLYFAENDTRTHLSRPPCDLPYFQNPVWTGPAPEVTCELLKMHFARALTHGHGFWWFDMWGGWYDDPDYMALMTDLHRIAEASLHAPRASAARVAVFADETVTDLAPADAFPVLYAFRRTLGLCGIPYDVYLAPDYELVRDRYDVIVVLAPDVTPDIVTIVADHPSALIVDGTNAGMTPSELRSELVSRGAAAYTDTDAVIYENQSWLFLHTCTEQMLTLHTPFALEEVFGRAPAPGAGKSYLFKKL